MSSISAYSLTKASFRQLSAKMYVAFYVITKLSKKEHRADALALRADERRDKLRKAAVRGKYP